MTVARSLRKNRGNYNRAKLLPNKTNKNKQLRNHKMLMQPTQIMIKSWRINNRYLSYMTIFLRALTKTKTKKIEYEGTKESDADTIMG